MEVQLAKADEFQERVIQLVTRGERELMHLVSIIVAKVTVEQVIVAFTILLLSILSYRLGKKRETRGYLTNNLKRSLLAVEEGVSAVRASIESRKILLRYVGIVQLSASGIAASFLCYQGIIDYTSDRMWIVGLATTIYLMTSHYWKNYLTTRIKQLTLRVNEDLSKQQLVLKKMLDELSDKSRAKLNEIVNEETMRTIQHDNEQLKRTMEQRAKQKQEEQKEKIEELTKRYQARIEAAQTAVVASTAAAATSTATASTTICTANICKKKKKLIKEKAKRNDWFIRNISEFAWCELCAANMSDEQLQQQPSPRNISNDDLDFFRSEDVMGGGGESGDVSLDSSFILETGMDSDASDSPLNRSIVRDGLFQSVGGGGGGGGGGSGNCKECVSNCLNKYFFLCRRIGEKYNQWTECIEKYEEKYTKEKLTIKALPFNVDRKGKRQSSA